MTGDAAATHDDRGDHGRQGAGQPRPQAERSVRSPTAAERARTLVEGNSTGALDIPGCEFTGPDAAVPAARAVLPDGDLVLLMANASPVARLAAHAQDDDLAAVLEITDVAPVAVAHRVRGRAWVAGWLSPVPEEERAACALLLAERQPVGEVLSPEWVLLRLETGEILVDDLWGADQVEPDDFADAAADPLAACEAELLQHLAAAHGDQVQGLCALLGGRNPACGTRAVPLSLDRFGLRVRFTGGDRVFDARFDFPEPVTGHHDLRRAMRTLFEAAFEAPQPDWDRDHQGDRRGQDRR